MKPEQLTKRLQKLIARLKGGGDITTSSMTRVLTEAQMNQFHLDWKEQLTNRKIKKPTELTKYQHLVKVAILHYSRMERYSFISSKHRLASKFALKADQAFEEALEYLRDIMTKNPDIRMWIDREITDSSHHPIGIPRVIGSSSSECLVKAKNTYPTFTKKDLKLETLEMALLELQSPVFESFCEPMKSIYFSKTKNHDFSSFKF